jgi:hypothetical protein
VTGIESFEDVRDLGEPELRELLEHGRPEERVWAIWALALRSAGHAHELAQHRDPDPGVRRSLAIVLAGHGELELLVALAHRDPAPEVRAGALQLVTRLAMDGKLSPELVAERVATDVSEVRIAVLGTVFAGAPQWLVDVATRLLEDRDGDVRYEAFEALARAGDVARALAWLEEAPEAEARLTLMRWSARGRTRTCADMLAVASRRLRRLLVESVRIAAWQELAPVIDGDPQLLAALLKRDPMQLDRVPLVQLVRATLADPNRTWLGTIRARLAQLEVAPDEVAALLPDLNEACVHMLGRLEGWRGSPDEAELDLEGARLDLEAMLDQVARLLVH